MTPIIDLIHSRRSIGKLSLPIPNDAELSAIIGAAMSAPDHKLLRPYRLVVMTGAALDEFGQVLLKAGQQKAQYTGVILDDAACVKLINMPKRAPMIITVATDYKEHDKVPPFEQLLCVGALIQNLLLALESLGYHSVWRTGDLCNEPAVKAHFGVDDNDTICGFIYVGSSDIVMPKKDAVHLDDYVKFYQ